MKTLNEIKETLNKQKAHLVQQYGLKNMAIFGSYGRQEQRQDSDIDILVEFSRPIGIEFIDLGNELERILKMKVDLVSRNGIKPKYFERIEKDLNYV
jgi:predicted nucleotidyltransferase